MRMPVIVSLLALGVALSACSTSRVRPDEFAVARQRPLVIPPDYALVPPARGWPRRPGPAATPKP